MSAVFLPTMAEFYRRTKVEELGAEHPGLLEFVEEAIRDKMPYPQICQAIQEQWGEEIDPQRISAHYTLRIWKKKESETQAYLEALGQGRALLQLQKEHPTEERQELISALLDTGIILQKKRLMESDPLKVLAERRRMLEAAGSFEIEKEKIQVDRERLQNEKQALELKVSRFQQNVKAATDEAEEKLGKGESLTLADINRIRERTFGLPAVEQVTSDK